MSEQSPVKEDQRERIEQIYRDQRDRLWRAVYALAGDYDLAADSVAEAFTQALRHGQLRDPLAWIWKAAFRIAMGELKRRRALTTIVEHPYSMPDSSIDLLQALARLSPKQRGSLILHYYAGYPTRDVAEILGSTAAAVRVHLSIGRRRLKELLGRTELNG